MNDAQIVEKLAGVLGVEKGVVGGRFTIHITNPSKVGWSDMDCFDDFNPLHDHNHMALVRGKMIDGGWWYSKHRGCHLVNKKDLVGWWSSFYNHGTGSNNKHEPTWAEDELYAEALAIIKAIGKESDAE